MSLHDHQKPNLNDIVDVDLAVLVLVQCVSDALQLLLRNVLDLPHDGDQLLDADEVLPKVEIQAAYRN